MFKTKHSIKRLVLIMFVAAAMLVQLTPYQVTLASSFNPNTDWMSQGVYGIDGPAPCVLPSNIPPGKTFEQYTNEYDANGAAQIAQDAGAAFLLINADSFDKYLIAPNAKFCQYTGYQPGQACSTRDTIDDIYNALNPRGIKLVLYIVGDLGRADSQAAAGLGWDGTANATYRSRLNEIYTEWSLRYGTKIAGWWVDGGWISGYTDSTLNDLANALRAGNPNAIVTFNPAYGYPRCFNRLSAAQDYTAGELHGLDHPNTSRWINDIQWLHYQPMGRSYCSSFSYFSDSEIVNYIQQVSQNGGVILLGTGATGAQHEFDTAQYEQLKVIKNVIKYGGSLENEACIDTSDTSVTLGGAWSTRTSGGTFYNGSERFSASAGNYVQLTFSGSSVKWLGASAPDCGIAEVYIDDVLDKTVNLWDEGATYLGTRFERQVLYTKSGLTDGQHTIRIVVKGIKDWRATAANVYVDAFIIDSVPSSSNLALNKTVTVSSAYPGGYEGYKAVDGNSATRWSSNFSDPQWIYTDLGGTCSIHRVTLKWETAYGSSYKIQVSNDASNWIDVYTTTTGDGGIDDISFSSVDARYVRMYGTVRGTPYGYSLWDFEVYGSSYEGNKIEAENATKGGSAANFADSHASGGYEVAYIDSIGSHVQFSNVPASSQLTVRYSRGSSVEGQLSLYVNGIHNQDIVFPVSGGWYGLGAYADKVVNVDIPDGATVKLQFDSGDAATNIDYVLTDSSPQLQYFVTGKSLGSLRNNFSGWVGMKITVGGSPITVTSLGRIFVSGNIGTHAVKIANVSDGTDVPNGSVSISMPGGSAGQYKYADLSTPVTLSANTSYYIVSQEVNGGDQWYDVNDTTITTTSAAVCDCGAVYGNSWAIWSTENHTYVPVDFRY